MNNLFLLILKMSASASIIILLLVALTSFLNKNYFMKWKYALWLCLAGYLCIPIDYAAIYRQLSRHFQVTPVTLSTITKVNNAIMTTFNTTPVLTQDVNVMNATKPVEAATTLPTPLTIISYGWFIGVIVSLIVHLISYYLYKNRLIASAKPVTKEAYQIVFSECLNQMDISKPIDLLVSSSISSPMVIGFAKSLLVLPHEAYSDSEIAYILKHELIHYKRHDIYGKLLLLFAKTIHWFNPIISLMYWEAVNDMEFSCDEGVVSFESFSYKKAYAETLFISLTKQNRVETYFSTQFQGGTKIMKKRFENILSKTNKRNGKLLLTVTLLLVITLGTLAGCSDSSNTEIIGGADSETSIELNTSENTTIESNAEDFTPPEDALKYTDSLLQKHRSLLSDATITLNHFVIAYFTEDVETLKTYLSSTCSNVETYPYGNTFNDVSELTFDSIHCSIANETEEFITISLLGTSSLIETVHENLLIDNINFPGPTYDIEDGFTYILSIPLKAKPYKNIELDYREYLTVELIRENGEWKIQSYGLEL